MITRSTPFCVGGCPGWICSTRKQSKACLCFYWLVDSFTVLCNAKSSFQLSTYFPSLQEQSFPSPFSILLVYRSQKNYLQQQEWYWIQVCSTTNTTAEKLLCNDYALLLFVL